MTKHLTLMLLGALVAATPAVAAKETPEAKLQKILEGRTAGTPVSCIPLGRGNQSSQVIEGKAIVYKIGGTLYVNEPRSGAEVLNDDDILATRTFTNQLCNTDAVQLIQRFTGIQQGFVLLDKFVPYTKAPKTN